MPIPNQLKEKPNFKVLGANWFVDLDMDPDEFDDKEFLLMEVATRGVEAYLRGEHTVEDRSKGTSGFGIVIVVEHSEHEWAVPADMVLFNAGQHVIGQKIAKRIKKNNNNT